MTKFCPYFLSCIQFWIFSKQNADLSKIVTVREWRFAFGYKMAYPLV